MTPPFDAERELQRHGASLHALARALLGDPQHADDAVQDTAVYALQRPPRHAASTGGWLRSVLRNVVRQGRRAQRRRDARELAVAKSEAVPAADAVAARRELAIGVVEAVHALPEPYRETVWQRYFEELSPAVIALRNGVPVATVKSRLQRGLAMLRERLDRDGERGDWRAGLATAFGIGGGAGAGAAVAAGVLLMGTAAKLMAGGAVVLAATAALWWATADAPSTPIAKTAAPSASPPAAATAAIAPPIAPQRAEVTVPAAPDPALAQVRGRCVDELGAPLAGCTARLSAWWRDNNPPPGTAPWPDPALIVTGADGRFDFAFPAPSHLQFAFSVHADGRVPRSGRWATIAPAQVIELGDIRLAPGFEVRGRVVDEEGAPVPQVTVRISDLPLPIQAGQNASSTSSGTSRSDGSFVLDAPVPPGSYPLAIQRTGMRLGTPDHMTIGERGADPLLVTVRRMPSIRGMVVDDLGQPVRGVSLHAERNQSGLSSSSTTDKDGAFTLYAVDAEPQPAQLEIDDPGPCEASWHDRRLWAWGTRDLRIELRRALTVELSVVEMPGGRPVTDFAVSCHPEAKAGSSSFRELRLAGEHPGGRVTVDRVWRGRNSLRVLPRDPALRASARVVFEASDVGVAPLRVEVERLQPATVRVTTGDGRAVEGAAVEVVAKGSEAFDDKAQAVDPRSGNEPYSNRPGYRPHECLAAAVTGADGRARVRCAPGDSELAVRVRSERHPTTIVDAAVFASGQDLVVVVPEAGGITGTVLLQGLDPERVVVKARSVGEASPVLPRELGKLQQDGRFALHGLTPGRYRLQLKYEVVFRTLFLNRCTPVLDVQVNEVTVEAGRDTEVRIDATAVAPATVRGRVLLDGEPPAAARVFLASVADDEVRHGWYIPTADGSFEATGLLPGSYRAGLVLGDFTTGPGDVITLEETFAVAAGEQVQRLFAFARRRLVLTVVQADGKTPVVGVQCTFHSPTTAGEPRPRVTDQDGKVVVDPMPRGELWVWVIAPRVERAFGPFEIPPGKTEQAVTLTLPAK